MESLSQSGYINIQTQHEKEICDKEDDKTAKVAKDEDVELRIKFEKKIKL